MQIPKIGLGSNVYTWQNESITDIANIIPDTLKIGYRFFDLPENNTTEILNKINESKINRNELFISQKIFSVPSIMDTKKRVEQIQYLDLLYLANPPITSSRITFNASLTESYLSLLKVKAEGLVKNIGICNFHKKQLQLLIDLCDQNEVDYPDYAFLEIHPINRNPELYKLYNKYNIKIISYSSIGGTGTSYYAEDKEIQNFVKKNKMSSYTQAVLGHTISTGYSVLVKSINIEHLKQNFETLKFVKTDFSELDDMNIYSPLNNDTSNAMVANGELLY